MTPFHKEHRPSERRQPFAQPNPRQRSLQMPQATHTHITGGLATPSRRHLVGGSILAALSGAAFGSAVMLPDPGEAPPALVNPDAELIGLCAECDALQDRIDATYVVPSGGLTRAQELAREKARDIVQEPLRAAQDPLLDRICTLRATTAQGRAARARTLLSWDKDPCWTHDGCWNSQLIGAIVRDTVAGFA